MAKLNEVPPPPIENIDALKRRFIRQNREIARVNSTQSQRIRNLEAECARLVAENVSLREQAIAAQVEAERWRNANSMGREVLDMKERFVSKVNEMSLLLVEMGQIPERAAKRGRRKSRISASQSLAEQEWRSRQSMREAAAEERDMLDGRLPPISEDKLYPRRTLESAEVMALRDAEALQQASESPELGPPPVAHFDVGDVVAFDTATTENKNDEDLAQLPPMLEKRRKRRTSALLQDMPIEEHSEQEKSAHQLLKSGAKRKLDLTELEEPVPQQPSEIDDFVFQRKQDSWSNQAALKKPSRFTRPPGRENEEMTVEKSLQSPQKSAGADRKILAPKSTNSPTKRKVRVAEKLSSSKDNDEERQISTTNRHARRSHVRIPPEVHDLVLESEAQRESNNLPPKTPAPEDSDVLSPTSTEPSVRMAHHTREAAITNSVEDVLNGSIGRGSRRARPAVSYALPNLRDKMRRPTKELVGAVEGLEKNKENTAASNARGTSTERERSEGANPAGDQEGILKMKPERHASGDEWKELPLSSDKKEEPPSPLEDKERKEKDREKFLVRHDQDRAGKRDSNELERAVDRLSIFDPPAADFYGTNSEETPGASCVFLFRRQTPTIVDHIAPKVEYQSTSPTTECCGNLEAGFYFWQKQRSEALE
ncbi:hypothetical protein LTR10_016734 [Elasticomyces elasticus]|uniref:Shugoshin C-terminal domain-containing protein n=1 Tax=Exophiala sideris TaxID=1016849 RepID=A0ABR0JSA9_9EURO|nr:hypothetical protein LTR10_016734 [Elasticomyces elasticus]KAK5039827.1 hypothetical protein LTS07_000322 [Exophiala sideris]KAK5041379.1 hypothetical protein LTR13_002854 [Exophiala sideris]KAK5068206.1 hypothetical protein LTR69_000324 [Exophiala sideris]KAK5187507.1 hypothetical protein LTR44_000323 [Eurotiomycetes sp. CCFEE 6388]